MIASENTEPQNAAEFATTFPVSRETLARLEAFVAHLEKWQKKMNLVAQSTLNQVWTRHILDSAQLVPLLAARKQNSRLRIADVGSGAGFPGLILAILHAGDFHLIESDQRRAIFLQEALRITGISAEVHAVRTEDLKPMPMDVVTARACAPLNRLLEFVTPLVGQDTTCLFLKGQDVDKELTEATKYWSMEVIRHPSVTDADATILQLDKVRPRNDRARNQ